MAQTKRRVGGGRTVNTITARLDNATDALYHNHLNYLKDLAPEAVEPSLPYLGSRSGMSATT